jgi:hypothetical protein
MPPLSMCRLLGDVTRSNNCTLSNELDRRNAIGK